MLVAREAGVTKYYPAVSNDDKLVVYNQSTCGFDPDVYTSLTSPQVGVYGAADLRRLRRLVGDPVADQPRRCARRSGSTAPTAVPSAQFDNSWPRWSPDNGTFRGQKLYWLAFSSRRPYGLQVNTGVPAVDQAAALVRGGADRRRAVPGSQRAAGLAADAESDRRRARMPNQIPTGNHVPQWVKVAVVIPG